MAGVPADATTVVVGTGIIEVAVRVLGPVETELFPIGCKHRVLTFGIWGEGGSRFARCGLVCFAICWEMSGGSTAKAMRTETLLWALSKALGGQMPLRG